MVLLIIMSAASIAVTVYYRRRGETTSSMSFIIIYHANRPQKINNKHIESFILDMASGIGRQNGSWRGAETSCIVSNGVVV